jgi:lipoyl(octanoyl) transferase
MVDVPPQGSLCDASPGGTERRGTARRRSCATAVIVRRLGRSDYMETWRAMQGFTAARGPGTPDEIWLTEHPSIYTLGLAGRREHLLRDNGIPVVKVDRGGQVTYHGPGQLVAYTLVDLRRLRLGVRDMVRSLEAAVINWLGSLAIAGYGKPAAPGVYVRRNGAEAKIGALGLKVRNGCTYHGVAVNIAMDLAPFSDIDPCGYPGLAVTDVGALGPSRTVESAGEELAPIIAREVVRDR